MITDLKCVHAANSIEEIVENEEMVGEKIQEKIFKLVNKCGIGIHFYKRKYSKPLLL